MGDICLRLRYNTNKDFTAQHAIKITQNYTSLHEQGTVTRSKQWHQNKAQIAATEWLLGLTTPHQSASA